MRSMPRLATVVVVLLALLSLTIGGRAQDATPVATPPPQVEDAEEFQLLGLAWLDPVPQAPVAMALAHYQLDAGASDPAVEAPSARLLTLEAGSLVVETEGPATLIRADHLMAFEPGEELVAGTTVTLEAGEAIFLPANSAAGFRNDGAAVASGLLATVESIEPDPADQPAATPEAIATPAPGRTMDTVGFGVADTTPHPVAILAMVRLTYAVGAEDPAESNVGPLLAYVEQGTFGYTVEAGVSNLLRDPDATPPAADPAPAAATPGIEVELRAGDALFEQSGTTSSVRNVGDEPGSVILVVLIPPELLEEEATPPAVVATPIA